MHFSVTSAPLALTAEAAAELSSLLARETTPGLRLRVGVRPGGCSGFSYEMYFDEELADDDIAWDATAGEASVPVVVDPTSAERLQGATLRYVGGLQGTGFSIDNPNATRSCGCGKSFS